MRMFNGMLKDGSAGAASRSAERLRDAIGRQLLVLARVREEAHEDHDDRR